MIPATNQCLSGWTTEYAGFLVSSKSADQQYRAEFVSLDEHAEHTIHGDPSNNSGGRFVQAKVKCGALPCDPYTNNGDLLCVVCSRWYDWVAEE